MEKALHVLSRCRISGTTGRPRYSWAVAVAVGLYPSRWRGPSGKRGASLAAHAEVDGRSLLDEIAREGARRMLVAALETEVAAYLEAHGDERDDAGHALVVGNGKGRTRKITLGAGTIPVSAPRVNDRRTDQDGVRRRFTSRILPPYMRRSPKVAEVPPVRHEHRAADQRMGDGVPRLPEAEPRRPRVRLRLGRWLPRERRELEDGAP